jgi:hypothetical protein
MSLDLDAIRAHSKITRDGFYHVVGVHYVVREADFDALVAEVERLRAVEADAERARVKADLWSYYEALVQANGAEGITQLVVQRDEARAEVERLRERVRDYEDDAKTVLADRCALDERHCSCVPHLRQEVERLRDEADLLRTGREAARCYADRVEAEVQDLRGERAARAALVAEMERLKDMQPKRDYYASLGAAQERAAVVAWLRDEAARLRKAAFVGSRAYVLESTAYMIEQGIHEALDTLKRNGLDK